MVSHITGYVVNACTLFALELPSITATFFIYGSCFISSSYLFTHLSYDAFVPFSFPSHPSLSLPCALTPLPGLSLFTIFFLFHSRVSQPSFSLLATLESYILRHYCEFHVFLCTFSKLYCVVQHYKSSSSSIQF